MFELICLASVLDFTYVIKVTVLPCVLLHLFFQYSQHSWIGGGLLC